jgi:GNAT superfamily N-acetyltransferase
MNLIQLSANDSYFKTFVISVLNTSHNSKIRQKTLDFYRNGISDFLLKNGAVICVAGVDDIGCKIGISCCAFGIKSKSVIHSITVVDSRFRNNGYGKKLLNAKIQILRNEYPTIFYKSYVNVDNKYSILMCSAIGLIIDGEGQREREGKEPSKFLIFKDSMNTNAK